MLCASVFAYMHGSTSARVGCKYVSACVCLLGSAGGLDQYLEQYWANDSACTVWARIQPGQPSGNQSGTECDVTATELEVPWKLGEVNESYWTSAGRFSKVHRADDQVISIWNGWWGMRAWTCWPGCWWQWHRIFRPMYSLAWLTVLSIVMWLIYSPEERITFLSLALRQ